MENRTKISDFTREVRQRLLNEGHQKSLEKKERDIRQLAGDEIRNKLGSLSMFREQVQGTAEDFEEFIQESKAWLRDVGWSEEEIQKMENEPNFSRLMSNTRGHFLNKGRQK